MEPNIARLKRLKGITADDIGKEIMFCPDCDWQLSPGTYTKSICPECGRGLHISKIDEDLVGLVSFSSESLIEALKDLGESPGKYIKPDDMGFTEIIETLAIRHFVTMFGEEALELLNCEDRPKTMTRVMMEDREL